MALHPVIQIKDERDNRRIIGKMMADTLIKDVDLTEL